MTRMKIRYGEKRPIPGIDFSNREVVLEREIEIPEGLPEEDARMLTDSMLDEMTATVTRRLAQGGSTR